MIGTKGTARLGFFAALLALLIAPMAIGFQTTHAQGPTVATYYGITDAGATVGASIDGASCGETPANDAGQWLLSIDENGCDGAATDGATVSFSLNGAEAEQTETWSKGGGPADTVNGVTLTVAAMPEPTPEATEEAMPEATEEAMPEATEEGNARGDRGSNARDARGAGDRQRRPRLERDQLAADRACARHPHGRRHRRRPRLDEASELTFGPAWRPALPGGPANGADCRWAPITGAHLFALGVLLSQGGAPPHTPPRRCPCALEALSSGGRRTPSPPPSPSGGRDTPGC